MLNPARFSNVFSIFRQGGSANSGFMVLTLAPWKARERTQGQIVADINRATSKIPSVRAFTIQANSLGIRGAGAACRFRVSANDYTKLGDAAAKLVRQWRYGRFENVRLKLRGQPGAIVGDDRPGARLRPRQWT